jgi:hypothetical protein
MQWTLGYVSELASRRYTQLLLRDKLSVENKSREKFACAAIRSDDVKLTHWDATMTLEHDATKAEEQCAGLEHWGSLREPWPWMQPVEGRDTK